MHVAAAQHHVVGLKRGEASGPLSASAVNAVFSTPKDGAGKGDAAQPLEQAVFRVTDIIVPALDMQSQDSKKIAETLNRAVAEDIAGEYISRLEKDVGVTINQSALNQVIGGGAGTDAD